MCHKFNVFLNFQILLFIYLLFLSSFFQAQAQNEKNTEKENITELKFPYQNDLIITFSAKKVTFDNYNFPKITTLGTSKYDFYNYQPGILKVIYTEYFKKDTTEYISFLKINQSGMTFWYEDNDSIKVKKNTLAISLPLYKGKIWSTYLNDIRSEATCLTVDTVILTPFGDVHAFAIKYIIHIKKKSTKLIDYNIAFTEFYNQKYGKIRMHILEYGRMKDNNRIVKFKEVENTISTIIAPEIK